MIIVKFLPKNTTQYLQPGLEPGALYLESSAHTMRPRTVMYVMCF